MRETEQEIEIYVATDEKKLNVSFPVEWTIEDLCIKICKCLKIGPRARHLFALRCHNSKLWYPYGYKLDIREPTENQFDFCLRFKPSSLQILKETDMQAYNYYFMQVRQDILNNKVPDIIFEKHKREIIGLGVSDMYRVILEKNQSRETVESEYKKYIPKECIKRHAFFIKKPIRNALEICASSLHDASYVKEQYLKQFECIAPNYPYEEYKASMDKENNNTSVKVLLRVNAENVKYCETDTGTWKILCAIEDLCFISISSNLSNVEVSRKNGIPSYLRFETMKVLMSFVSALDGYYRLSVKWTFNLCRNVITPTLDRLYKLKCHGPIGEEFSYIKLREKRSNRPGTYILRESETEYNVYYMDVCGKDSQLLTQRIELTEFNKFLIVGTNQSYKSLGHLISSLRDPTNPLYLEECLPPSEYDRSPLLMCASENIVSEVAVNEEIITTLLEGGPRCVPPDQLQYETEYAKKLTRVQSATILCRAMWRVAKGKKLEVAMKILKTENYKDTKEFLELAGKWGQLRSGALVRLYGITVAPTIGMLLELVTLGPLDKYLWENSLIIKTVDLVEATACLATALWHLEENHIVHGNIRCETLFVQSHTDNHFSVKLGDPGLFTYILEKDIYWIPPECHEDVQSAKYSLQADIWASGTTIWQIFSKGQRPYFDKEIDAIKKFYQQGLGLPMPDGCPNEIYTLMLECWGRGNTLRKQPQAIMRDINQILYQVYNSRRTHTYEFPKLLIDFHKKDENGIDTEETKSNSESHVSSIVTDNTSVTMEDGDDATNQLVNVTESCVGNANELAFYMHWLNSDNADGNTGQTPPSSNHRDHPTHGNSFRNTARFNNGHATDNGSIGGSSNSSTLCQDTCQETTFELDAGYDVVQQGLIGQGFYGEVFRGTMYHEGTSQEVAIKKLKTRAEASLHDFEREINIMKTLQHDNIVKILGAIWDPDAQLIMEYVKHGSLHGYLHLNKESGILTHKRLLRFALDIATGMEYLGFKSIVHRDLAARNILVANENQVKISDFGLAQMTGDNDYYILQTNRDLPIKWYAPESLRDGKFSSRSDVWSFGVTMFETFSFGADPKLDITPKIGSNDKNSIQREINEGSELLSALERGTRLGCPSSCPQEVYVNLMRPCWNLQSHERPSFTKLRATISELLKRY